MANIPGLPGSQASNDGDMMRMIQDLQRDLRELKAQNLLATAGITVQPNGITVAGSETVNGPLTVNGPMSVTGTLTLPAGIIGNDALAAPVVISTSGLSQNNFGTTTGGAVYAAATVIIPAGYSQADVLCMVVAGAANSTTSTDFLYVSTTINGVTGGEVPVMAAPNGGYASGAANGIRTLTGLSGGTISLGAELRTGAAWALSSGNIANMNAVVFFRR